jgi:hypothetical protein
MRSNSMRGRINPKVIAVMIRNAVVPFVKMLISRAGGAPGPIETNSTRPVAALNRKNPGIKETTAEIDDRRHEDAGEHAGDERAGRSTASGEGDQRPARGMREHADCDRERQ